MRLFTPNHQALIQECYPPLVAATPLPSPVSNALSKLCFYASGRPKKLPKVAHVLLERAQKEARGSGQKAKTGLAVTVEIMRTLVCECKVELRCFAEQALKVAELGLGKTPGVREPEIEARAAGLFYSIAVYSSGPFSGQPEMFQKQYLRCLAQLSEMARLGPSDSSTRLIAISGLEGGAGSELLYGSAPEYESQIQHIVPALLYNCLDQSTSFLLQETNAYDTKGESPSKVGLLATSKCPAIEPPSQAPTPKSLATKAINILCSIDRLSTSVQLSSKLSAISHWLDLYQNGAIWKNREFVQWIGESTVSSSAVQYRAGVVTWWVESIAEVDDKKKGPVPAAKPPTLLYTLTAILQGPTELVGLGVGSVLGQLTSLVIARAVVGEDDDTFTLLLLRAIAALGSRTYYSDQVNDIVSDLVDQIKGLQTGVSSITSGLDDKGRKRAMKWLVSALRGVLEEAKRGNKEIKAAVPVGNANGKESFPAVQEFKRGMSEMTVKQNGAMQSTESGSNLDSLGRPIMQVSAVGRRNPVTPQVFQTSLFLLTETDAAVRHEYERALVSYIEGELVVGGTTTNDEEPTIDFSNELTRFFVELDAAVYELATSQTLGTADDPSSVYLGSIGSQASKQTKRRHSRSSRRRSIVGMPSVAGPFDYAALKRITQAVHLRGSALSVLSGVPMLIALDDDAVKWLGTLDQGAERVQACREVVASGLEAIGTAWGLTIVQEQARETLSTIAPSVLPYFGLSSSSQSTAARFASEARHTSATVDAGVTISAVSRCTLLQGAAMMNGAEISSILSAQWNVAEAKSSAAPPRAVYREAGSRSVTNLANLRVGHTPERARSIRAPSLIDLQNSMGGQGTGASAIGSRAPSIASTSATFATTDTRRRTVKLDAANVLASLRGTREQQQGASNGHNRLSVLLT